MSSVWTVKAETKPYDLVFADESGKKHDFTIELKKKLNVGEGRRVVTAGWRSVNAQKSGAEAAGTEINIDWKSQTFARVVEYLVSWTLKDDDGKLLPLSRDTVETLHEDVYELIEGAVTAHVKELEEAKKTRAGVK